MNVFKYINSKDIRDYLRKKGYVFNPMEAAWLVFQCHSATLEEKHKAFLEIIDTMPDCGIIERMNCMQVGSLHEFLKRYISVQDKYLKRIEQQEDGWVYRLGYEGNNGDWNHIGSILFSSYAKCLAYAKTEYAEFIDEIELFTIEKVKLNKEYVYIRVSLNKNFDAVDIEMSYKIKESDSDVLYQSFEGLWFNFPTPFVKGDIIWNPHRLCEGPIVLLEAGVDEKDVEFLNRMHAHNDNSDMNIVGYFLNDRNDRLYREVTWNYMDYEYCPLEKYENHKTVICMSNYLKGKIAEDLLIDAYHYHLLNKHVADDERPCYTRAGLVLAGVEEERHVKIWLDDERPAPEGYKHCRSVKEAEAAIRGCEYEGDVIDIIDCDHDLGEYAEDGGDGIKLLDWLVERGTFYPVKLHTMNAAAREYMQREIDRYWGDKDER